MSRELNREECLFLLRKHVATFAGMLESQNRIPKAVMAKGGGPENIGGLDRINELFALLPDVTPVDYQGGE